MKKLALFLLFAVCGFATECDFTPVAVPEPTPEAISFYKSGNVLWLVQLLWSLAIPSLILFSGFGVRLRDFCQKITGKWLWKTALFALFFLLIVTVLTLPLDFYMSYIRPHSYGLSNQTISRWLEHYLIGTGISTVVGIILVWILYGIIRVSPKRWWLYFGLLNFPLTLFIVLVYPLWVTPLFNHFGPMKNKHLEQKILDLASQAGIEGGRVYEVDMSADTKKINAYVTGLGTSKRIVIWDTAIEGLSEEQLLFVVGHEMGHYVLNHVWWGIGVHTALSLAILFLIYITGNRFVHRLGGWSDIASLPLIVLLYTFYSFLLSPVSNLASQKVEHDADTFGLELTHLNEAAATGFVKLQYNNLGYPWPGKLYMLFRASHPSIGSRITYFNTYHPWCEEKGSHAIMAE